MAEEKKKKYRFKETVTNVNPPSNEIKKGITQFKKPSKKKPKTTTYRRREE